MRTTETVHLDSHRVGIWCEDQTPGMLATRTLAKPSCGMEWEKDTERKTGISFLAIVVFIIGYLGS